MKMSDCTLNHETSAPQKQFSAREFVQPDGGFGWVVVMVAFFVQFFVLGTMNNYGILFSKLLQEFQLSKQQTSWVGSITYGVMFVSAPISTLLCERIGCRPVAVLGGLIASLATLLASFSKDIYSMYLTEGLFFGVGASLCYFPSLVILMQYFNKHLSLVNGLVSCGSGIGTMVMAALNNALNETYNWRASLRMTSALMLLVCVLSALYRPLIPPISGRGDGFNKKPFFDLSVFENKAFCVFLCALLLFTLTYFIPFVHLTQMAIEIGVPMRKAALLVGFMSLASTVGRLFFGKIADCKGINRFYMYQICFLGIAVANFLCPSMSTYTGLLGYCGIFGFFEGGYVCQLSVVTADIVGADRMPMGVGTLFGFNSIPVMLGPPLAGLMYDVSKSYQMAFYVAGTMPIISACALFLLPFLMPPPGHRFWKQPSLLLSKQHLIATSSVDSNDTTDSQPVVKSDAQGLIAFKKGKVSFTSLSINL